MGFGALRVWNDDEIAPGTGFPAHPHKDMEIITYVRHGAITHQDSWATRAAPKPATCRLMSAGIGNPARRVQSRSDADDSVPDLDRADPARRPALLGREAVSRNPTAQAGSWTLASAFRKIRTPCRSAPTPACSRSRFRPGKARNTTSAPGRNVYLVPATGKLDVNGVIVDRPRRSAIRGRGRPQDHGARTHRNRHGRYGLTIGPFFIITGHDRRYP